MHAKNKVKYSSMSIIISMSLVLFILGILGFFLLNAKGLSNHIKQNIGFSVMIKEGVKAAKYFSDKGIKTNCTLIFSAGQALLAAKAGATYVSPFIGRLDDVSTDGVDLIAQIREIYDNYMFDTEILAASVRHPMHIIQCAEIGADVMTGPLSAITALLNHPLTDIGLAKFLADFKKVNS